MCQSRMRLCCLCRRLDRAELRGAAPPQNSALTQKIERILLLAKCLAMLRLDRSVLRAEVRLDRVHGLKVSFHRRAASSSAGFASAAAQPKDQRHGDTDSDQ